MWGGGGGVGVGRGEGGRCGEGRRWSGGEGEEVVGWGEGGGGWVGRGRRRSGDWCVSHHMLFPAPPPSNQLGAELQAHAVSHLEHISAEGMEAMAQAGSVGVLLPTTAYILRLQPPPARRMIEKGEWGAWLLWNGGGVGGAYITWSVWRDRGVCVFNETNDKLIGMWACNVY